MTILGVIDRGTLDHIIREMITQEADRRHPLDEEMFGPMPVVAPRDNRLGNIPLGTHSLMVVIVEPRAFHVRTMAFLRPVMWFMVVVVAARWMTLVPQVYLFYTMLDREIQLIMMFLQ